MKFPALCLSFVNVWLGLGWIINLSRGPVCPIVNYLSLGESERKRKRKSLPVNAGEEQYSLVLYARGFKL